MQGDFLSEKPSGIIGVDEAGKGDYFGPLVIAACYANSIIEQAFLAMGLRESKKVTDNRAFALENEIKKIAPYEIVAIGPEKYNELYSNIRNLNRLLAWGHSRALENLLARVAPREVVSDQFGDKRLIENALMRRGKKVKLIQIPKAESIPAVAAASILARAEFLRRLDRLSEQFAIVLPKGAGTPVDEAAIKFIKAKGRDLLPKVAKMHFKNTNKIPG